MVRLLVAVDRDLSVVTQSSRGTRSLTTPLVRTQQDEITAGHRSLAIAVGLYPETEVLLRGVHARPHHPIQALGNAVPRTLISLITPIHLGLPEVREGRDLVDGEEAVTIHAKRGGQNPLLERIVSK